MSEEVVLKIRFVWVVICTYIWACVYGYRKMVPDIVAVFMLETGNLTSTLSAPPNHNLCGMAVVTSRKTTQNGQTTSLEGAKGTYASYWSAVHDFFLWLKHNNCKELLSYEEWWKLEGQDRIDNQKPLLVDFMHANNFFTANYDGYFMAWVTQWNLVVSPVNSVIKYAYLLLIAAGVVSVFLLFNRRSSHKKLA